MTQNVISIVSWTLLVVILYAFTALPCVNEILCLVALSFFSKIPLEGTGWPW